MATSISGSVSLSVQMQSTTPLDLGSASFPVTLLSSFTFANGTGSGNANKMFTDTRAVLSGQTDNVDLSGSLTNEVGTVLAFTKIKVLIIIAAATNTVNLTVGNGSTPAVGGPLGATGTNALVMQPGDVHAFLSNSAAGLFSVTNASADILKVLAGAADSAYSILIIGE